MNERESRKAICPRQKLFGNPRRPRQPPPVRAYQPYEWAEAPPELRARLRAEHKRLLEPPALWRPSA